MQIPLIII